jgi:hypothetical protein
MKIKYVILLILLLIPLSSASVNLQGVIGSGILQPPYLYNNGSNVYFNESHDNKTHIPYTIIINETGKRVSLKLLIPENLD